MIISPPFLPLKDTPVYSEEDVRFLMPDAAPGNGFFPVSQALAWHGGMHFSATSTEEPVRAIADGVVIFKRDAELARYDLQDHSTGCVVLRHTTEIGAQGNTATEVVFYSIYQHLRALDKDLPAVGQTIYRKDKLGLAGFVHGVANRIHLEIIAGDADAQKLLGRSTGDLDLTRDGRTDSVYGQIYVLLPSQSHCYASDPRAVNNPAPAGNSGPDRLIIGIQYAMGQAILTTYQLTGKTLGSPVPEADAEYNLYAEATRRHNNLRANLQAGGSTNTQQPGGARSSANLASATALPDSSPSGWYELLRFGRNLGPDPLPSNAAHWRQVALPGQAEAMWVDLNAAGTMKFSDADFPQWMGWKLVDDDSEDGNSQCNSALIDVMLSPLAQPQTAPSLTDPTSPVPETAQTTPDQKAANRLRSLADTDIQQQLVKTICKFPTEWADAEVRTRWAWVRKQGNPHIPYPLEEEIDFTEMSDFAQKLCFWEKLPDEDKKRLTQKHWHFNAREFIVHFRKCGWLAKKEFIQLIPLNIIRKPGSHNSKTNAFWESPNIKPAKYLILITSSNLNTALRKFTINTPIRLACFFGNATQETIWFSALLENHGKSPDLHQGWYGRGFLQLTSPNGNINNGNNNYYKYFKFSGKNPMTPPRPTEISWRNEIGDSPYHAAHSACAYWVWENKSVENLEKGTPQVDNTNKYADTPNKNIRNVISTENNGEKIWYYNQSFTNCATAVNYPASTGRNPPNMNGLVDRSTAFINALMVLSENPIFDNGKQGYTPVPENFSRRKIS
jgi:hydroxyethylthiazole kinase